jgi:hypothetical protein
MRLIIAGTRTFNDYELLRKTLDGILKNYTGPIEVVSGSAKGADKLGERYAASKGYKVSRFFPDWGNFGKRAGPVRNELMAKYSTHCVCFWDNISRGTKSMIDLAKKHNLNLRVIIV